MIKSTISAITAAESLQLVERGRFYIKKVQLNSSIVYGLQRKDGDVLGWATVKIAHIASKSYYELGAIYFLPAERKSFAVGMFIYALKELLDFPVILGTDITGGVLFKDGLSILQRMSDSHSMFQVQLLNLHNGETQDLPDNIKDLSKIKYRGFTVMFESANLGFIHDSGINLVDISLFEDVK